MEQIPIDFAATPDAEASERNLESLDNDELATLYAETVEIDPTFRAFNRATLIQGIQDPEAERARLLELDRGEDREELPRSYRH